MATKNKKRTHNEYFRRVFVKTVHGYKTREQELVDEILARDPVSTNHRTGQPWTREELEAPYSTIVGYESRRKSCPNCGDKLEESEWVYSWGEYINVKWNTVTHFCKHCFQKDVQQRLIAHRDGCGCDFDLIGKDGELPDWLTLPTSCQV